MFLCLWALLAAVTFWQWPLTFVHCMILAYTESKTFFSYRWHFHLCHNKNFWHLFSLKSDFLISVDLVDRKISIDMLFWHSCCEKQCLTTCYFSLKRKFLIPAFKGLCDILAYVKRLTACVSLKWISIFLLNYFVKL